MFDGIKIQIKKKKGKSHGENFEGIRRDYREA